MCEQTTKSIINIISDTILETLNKLLPTSSAPKDVREFIQKEDERLALIAKKCEEVKRRLDGAADGGRDKLVKCLTYLEQEKVVSERNIRAYEYMYPGVKKSL